MHTFFGGGGNFLLMGFFTDIISNREGSFQGGYFTLEEFARIPIGNSSYVLLSHCRHNFTHEHAKGYCPV